MKTVYSILQQIRNTSSTKEKEAILNKNKENLNLREYLALVYDKATFQYYCKKNLSKLVEVSNNEFISFQEINVLCESLSTRKVTGNAAIELIKFIVSGYNEESVELFQNMLDRDVHCNFGTTIINKVWKGLVKDLPYMRCSLFDSKLVTNSDWKSGVYSQRKMDGSFANITMSGDDKTIEILTRQSSVYNINDNIRNIVNDDFRDIVEELQSLNVNNVVFNGEFVVYDNNGLIPRELSNGILNSILKGGQLDVGQYIKYVIWDMIPIEYFHSKGKYDINYSVRYNSLIDIIDGLQWCIEVVENRIVHSHDEALDHYKEIVSQGGEGTVLKISNAIWRDGTSKQQLKLKVEAECELVVTGYNEGKGKHSKTFGSLVCESSDENLVVSVSGFSDSKRLELYNDMNNVIGSIITVRYNAITKCNGVYSLQLPRYLDLRFDKAEADSLEDIISIFNRKIGK